jgi:hypothetical protein
MQSVNLVSVASRCSSQLRPWMSFLSAASYIFLMHVCPTKHAVCEHISHSDALFFIIIIIIIMIIVIVPRGVGMRKFGGCLFLDLCQVSL